MMAPAGLAIVLVFGGLALQVAAILHAPEWWILPGAAWMIIAAWGIYLCRTGSRADPAETRAKLRRFLPAWIVFVGEGVLTGACTVPQLISIVAAPEPWRTLGLIGYGAWMVGSAYSSIMRRRLARLREARRARQAGVQ